MPSRKAQGRRNRQKRGAKGRVKSRYSLVTVQERESGQGIWRSGSFPGFVSTEKINVLLDQATEQALHLVLTAPASNAQRCYATRGLAAWPPALLAATQQRRTILRTQACRPCLRRCCTQAAICCTACNAAAAAVDGVAAGRFKYHCRTLRLLLPVEAAEHNQHDNTLHRSAQHQAAPEALQAPPCFDSQQVGGRQAQAPGQEIEGWVATGWQHDKRAPTGSAATATVRSTAVRVQSSCASARLSPPARPLNAPTSQESTDQ